MPARILFQLRTCLTAGDVIAGTGGLRKLRLGDPTRGKDKRGGLRIYYWYEIKLQF